jgi:hypothetical protein
MGIFRLVGLFRYCFLGLLFVSQLANAQRTVIPAPSEFVRTYGSQPFQFSDSRNWNATVSTQAGSAQIPVKASKGFTPSKIVGAAKNLLKVHPAKIAGTALALYLIDQLPGTSFIDGVPHRSSGQTTASNFVCTNGVPCWNSTYHGTGDNSCTKPSPLAAFQCSAALRGWSTTVAATGIISGDPNRVYYNSTSCPGNVSGCAHFNVVPVFSGYSWGCPSGTTYDSVKRECRTAAQPLPFVDADYDAFVTPVNNLPPDLWSSDLGPLIGENTPATFDGPDFQDFTGPPSIDLPTVTSTTTTPSGTTVTETMPSIQLDYSSNPDAITATPTTTTNTYENGTQTSTTTTTTNTTETSSPTIELPEVPTDCEFMPTVCAFIDWVKTPFDDPEPDLSDILADEDFTKNVEFASNATCPAPAVIDTAFGSFNMSWEPGCQWAGMIKPFILMAALLSAIFIAMGAVRGGD